MGIDDRRRSVTGYYRWISALYAVHEDWFEGSLRERVLEFLSPREGERILEIGCGTGVTLREIAGAVGPSGRVLGLDLSIHMLKKASGRCRVARGVRLVRGDAESVPCRDAAYDAVVMSGVLELHGEETGLRILAEARRVLKPSGRMVLAVMRDDGKASAVLRVYQKVREVLPGILPARSVNPDALLSRAGLEAERGGRVRLRGLVPIEVLLLRPI